MDQFPLAGVFFARGGASARVAIVPLVTPFQPGVIRGYPVARARVLAVRRGWASAVVARLLAARRWQCTACNGAQPCRDAYR